MELSDNKYAHASALSPGLCKALGLVPEARPSTCPKKTFQSSFGDGNPSTLHIGIPKDSGIPDDEGGGGMIESSSESYIFKTYVNAVMLTLLFTQGLLPYS